jgi:hypothetical protein
MVGDGYDFARKADEELAASHLRFQQMMIEDSRRSAAAMRRSVTFIEHNPTSDNFGWRDITSLSDEQIAAIDGAPVWIGLDLAPEEG